MLSVLSNHGRWLCCRLRLHAGGSDVRLYDGPDLKLFILVGWDRSFLSAKPTFNWWFCFGPELVSYFAPRDLHRRAAYSICESSFMIHHGGCHDLFVLDDSLTS